MTANDVEPKLRGLSQVEARQRLAAYGPNALPEAKPIGLWQRLLSQFKSALIYILLFALALDLALWLHEGAKLVPHEVNRHRASFSSSTLVLAPTRKARPRRR